MDEVWRDIDEVYDNVGRKEEVGEGGGEQVL
jgi:hypothetical protein